jgi:hypothetical protein
MNDFGKILVILGVGLVLIGGVLWSGFGKNWLGRLPGDISIEKEHFKFYFPIATSLLVSALLTLIFWLYSLIKK